MTSTAVLARISETVGYLRIEVAPGGDERDWLGCADLIHAPDHLADLAAAAGPHLGTEELEVALSLFVQGYAFRVASTSIGAWLLDDVAIDVDPSRMEVALAKGRPNAVRFTDPMVAVEAPATVDDLHDALVERHLAGLVDAAHQAGRVGRALLWGNVGASLASAFGAFSDPLADRCVEVRARAQDFFAAARPELASAGAVVPVGDRWLWQRNACCLWFKTASAYRCEDCSLATPEERQVRIDALLEAQDADV